MKNINSISAVTALIISMVVLTVATAVPTYAQVQGQGQPTAQPQERYQSPFNNYAITLAPGFVIQDISQIGLNRAQELLQSTENFEHIGTICLAHEATPTYGGNVECDPSAETDATLTEGAEIRITRFSDLQQRPAIQGNILAFGKQITPADILRMDMETSERVIEIAIPGSEDIVSYEIVNQTPINISYVNDNGTKQTLPAVYAETALMIGAPNTTVGSSPSGKLYGVYAVTPDQQTGYAVVSPRWPGELQTGAPPTPVDQMLRSFEVIQ